MAWISGLADKAENILNKLDQNAASALQVTATTGEASASDAGESSALEAMRRSLSSSKLSLKSALSPAKVRNAGSSFVSSAKVDTGNVMATSGTNLQDSLEPKGKLDWNVNSAVSSRRSSINSHVDAVVAIEVEETSPTHDVLKKVAPEGSLLSSSADGQELMAFKIALSEVTGERDELRARINAMNRDNEKALLLQKLQETESLLQRLTDERDQAQHELGSAQSTINAYMHSISELESNLAKIQQEYLEAAHKLQMQMKETEQQRKELREYRVKAQLALQMKDNLITELKANGTTATTTVGRGEGETDLRLLQMEFDALKQEHQQTLEECNTMRIQLEELRSDWQLVNEQHTTHTAAARAAEDALRKELRTERERLLAAESEQRVQAQELVKLRQQLSNQMAASATRLQEKETQLQQLRAEMMRRKMTVRNGEDGMTEDNFNDRIKALTQTLVDKQQTVELITAERNALRIQLEKMQDQLQQQYAFESSLHSGRTASRNALLSNTTDDVKAQFPLLMRENPFDNRVARRVKRVYSSLDSAGIRLGAFLRRYPLMRIFVLMYVGLLHLWVVFVLISSSPN